MALAHFARRLEDNINKRWVVRRRGKGWRPQIIGYTGYGSTASLHVLARVVMADPDFHLDGRTPRSPGDGYDSIDELGQIDDHETPTFQQSPAQIAIDAQRGWRNFWSTPVGFLPVTVRAGDQVIHTTTDRGGYLEVLLQGHNLEPGWHEVTIESRAAEPATARALVVSSKQRFGLVSDIDDTVMVTFLPRALIAAWNTFVKHSNTRQPVPGMAELYRELKRRNPDMPVFYLSTGAWNVVPTLRRFFKRNKFPYGPMLMTDWGPTQTGLFRSGQEHKRVQLRNLAVTFPHMTWLLVGDDGQHDPNIYDDFAREHPTHVAAIAIRTLSPTEQVLSHGTTEAMEDVNRLRNAQQEHGVPQIFGKDGFELQENLLPILSDRQELITRKNEERLERIVPTHHSAHSAQ